MTEEVIIVAHYCVNNRFTCAAKSVVGQNVASIARASEGPHRISADLLTDMSAFSAFVDFYNETMRDKILL